LDCKFGTASGGGGGDGSVTEEYTYTDTDNVVVGPLGTPPTSVSETLLWLGGLHQIYTSDYTLRPVVGGSAPGWYICLAPTRTAPGGGSFSGGSNPGTGIEPLLAVSDALTALYRAA